MDQRDYAVFAASLALVLLAAKAHGRQIRMERKQAGYPSAVFGGDNPAFVTALWRRDRIVFWSAFGALMLTALAYAFSAARYHWPLPFRWVDGIPPLWSLPLCAGIWPLICALTAAGFASIARSRSGGWGSLGWWSATLAVASGIAFAAFRP